MLSEFDFINKDEQPPVEYRIESGNSHVVNMAAAPRHPWGTPEPQGALLSPEDAPGAGTYWE